MFFFTESHPSSSLVLPFPIIVTLTRQSEWQWFCQEFIFRRMRKHAHCVICTIKQTSASPSCMGRYNDERRLAEVNYFKKESRFVWVFFHKEATSVQQSRCSDVRLIQASSRLIEAIMLTVRLDQGCLFWYLEMSKQVFQERCILAVKFSSTQIRWHFKQWQIRE